MPDDMNLTPQPSDDGQVEPTAWMRAVQASPLEPSTVASLFGEDHDDNHHPEGDQAPADAEEPAPTGLAAPESASAPIPAPAAPAEDSPVGLVPNLSPLPAPEPSEAPASDAVCPTCGAPIKPGARFCATCGTPAPSAEAASPATSAFAWSSSPAEASEPAAKPAPEAPVASTEAIPAPQPEPEAPRPIETPSATTDRDAARGTGPAPFLIAGGIVLGLVVLALGIGSCTSVAIRVAADQGYFAPDDSYYDEYYDDYDDYDDYDYDDYEYEELLRELFGDGSGSGGRRRERGDGSSRGGESSRKDIPYTMADVLADNQLVLFDGLTLSVKASSYSGVQEPVANYVRALVSADQQAVNNVVTHLRAASAASDDETRSSELSKAAEIARDAIQDLDEISAPDSTEVEATDQASVSRIVRDASSVAGDLTERWENELATIEAVREPLRSYEDLADLDEKASESLNDASEAIEELLAEAAR